MWAKALLFIFEFLPKLFDEYAKWKEERKVIAHKRAIDKKVERNRKALEKAWDNGDSDAIHRILKDADNNRDFN